MIDLGAVQNLLSSWWVDYDQGNFDSWPGYFTTDAHFSCQSDSGQTDFEEFIRADITGRDEILVWQEDHRRNSPLPLRHNATNIHLTASRATEADFRFYLFVTQIVGGAVSNLSTGVCVGTAVRDGDTVRIADLRVILDFTDSELFSSVRPRLTTP